MSSNIITSNIDKDFPVPGRDNDSSGFRNNFKSIADNLDVARDEIGDLQNTSLRTNKDNDLLGNTIKNVTLQNSGILYFDNGNIDSNISIDFNNGQFQSLTATSDISISIIGWPEKEVLSSILIAIKNDGVSRKITFAPSDNQEIKFDEFFPEEVIITSSLGDSSEEGYQFFEVFSFNNGKTLNITYKGPYSSDISETKKFKNIQAEDVQIDGNLVVSGQTTLSNIVIPKKLGLLEDVVVSTAEEKQILRYNDTTETWESSDQEKVVDFSVQVQDSNIAPGQKRFFISGVSGEPNFQEITEIANFTFDVDKIYRFDLSHSSNSESPLRFSTTPDVPDQGGSADVTPFNDNVEIFGNPGEPGSFVQIKITDTTPSSLFLYGIEIFFSTSLIGGGNDGEILVGIKRKEAVFNRVTGNVTGDVTGNVAGNLTGNVTSRVFDHGNLETSTDISFSDGSYHVANITGNLSLTFKDWPDSGRGKITVQLTNTTSNPYTVNWSTEQPGIIRKNLGEEINISDSNYGDSTIAFSFKIGEFPDPLELDAESGTYILEFWTADGGSNVFANFIGEFADV